MTEDQSMPEQGAGEVDIELQENERQQAERSSDVPLTDGAHIDGPQQDTGRDEWHESGQPMAQAVDPHNERVETTQVGTSTGNASASVADAPNTSGSKRPAPEIGDADQAASRESRRIAEAQDTEL